MMNFNTVKRLLLLSSFSVAFVFVGCSTTGAVGKNPSSEPPSSQNKIWTNIQTGFDYGDYGIHYSKVNTDKGKVTGKTQGEFGNKAMHLPDESIYDQVINEGKTAWVLDGKKDGLINLQLQITKNQLLIKLGCDLGTVQIVPNAVLVVPILHHTPFIYLKNAITISTHSNNGSFCELKLKPDYFWIEYYGINGKYSIKLFTMYKGNKKLFGTFSKTNI